MVIGLIIVKFKDGRSFKSSWRRGWDLFFFYFFGCIFVRIFRYEGFGRYIFFILIKFLELVGVCAYF